MTTHKSKVLFLSTGDATRGLMAEGFLRKLTGARFDVVSASVETGALDPLSDVVMKEAGIDISGQKPKSIADSLKQRFSHVIAICDTAKERTPIFPFALGVLCWNIVDPNCATGLLDQKTAAFRRVRDAIKDKVTQFVTDTAEIKESAFSIA